MERNETQENRSTGLLFRVITTVECVLLVLVTGWMLVSQLVIQTAPAVETVVLVAQMCFLLLSFRLLPERCPMEIRLLQQGSVWLFAAQALTERLGWGVFYPLSIMLLTLAAASLGQRLHRDRRKLEMQTVMMVWCGILAVMSVCGLLTVFAGRTLPGTVIQASALAAGANKLTVFGLFGEAVACALAAGIGVLLVQCFSSKGWLWKVLTVICLPLFLLVMLLENCIPAFLAVAVMVGLLLAELLQRPMRVRMKKTAPRVLMTLLAAVVICAGAFAGLYIGGGQMTTQLNAQPAAAQTDTAEDAQADDTQADAAQPTDADPADNTDPSAEVNSEAATQDAEAQSAPQTPTKPADAPTEAVTQAEDQSDEAADKSAAEEAAAAAAASAVQEAEQAEALDDEPTDAPSEAAQLTEAEDAPAPAVKGKAQAGVTAAPAMVETHERKNWSDVRGELEGYPQGLLFGLAEFAPPVPVHDQALYLLWQGGVPLVLMMAAVALLLIWRLAGVYFKADQEISAKVRCTAAALAGLLVLACTMPLMEEAFSFAWVVFALLLGWFIQAGEECGVTVPQHQRRVPRASYNPQRLHNSGTPAAPEEEIPLEEDMDAQNAYDGSEWEETPVSGEMDMSEYTDYPEQGQEAYPQQEPERPETPADTGAEQ